MEPGNLDDFSMSQIVENFGKLHLKFLGNGER